jgi:hypothetical protein
VGTIKEKNKLLSYVRSHPTTMNSWTKISNEISIILNRRVDEQYCAILYMETQNGETLSDI